MPPSTRTIPDAHDQVIVRAAMVRANAFRGRSRSLESITRALGPHRDSAEVDAVLDALVGAGDAVEPTGGHFRLTAQGHSKVRHAPSPPFRSTQ